MATSISVKNLKKYYGPVKAVDGISFEVKTGTIFGMLGPNGAGKTTTIETLIGLLDKNGGEIDVLGLDPDRDLDELKKRIGVQLQNPAMFPRLTVKETLELFASFYPNPLSVKDSLQKVGLEGNENKRIDNLSGGQKHRLAVSLALVSNGEIIFLDEPTTGLDPQARRRLWEVISNLRGEGVTVFLTTHYMDEAEELCDYLVIIDHGKIIAEGSPQDLIDQYFKERAVEFTDPGFTDKERGKLQDRVGNRMSYNAEDERIIIYTEKIPRTCSGIMDYSEQVNKPLDDIVVRHATLEDVFLKLTGRGIRE